MAFNKLNAAESVAGGIVGGLSGAQAGAPFGPVGIGIGAAAGAMPGVIGLIRSIFTDISQQRAQQQQILNSMLADGYQVGSELPKGLVAPRDKIAIGTVEGSRNPKPKIFFDNQNNPALSIRPLKPATGQSGVPLPQAKPGGFGEEAEINQQALQNLNNAYYNGQPAQFSDTMERLYSNAPIPGANGQPAAGTTGSYSREPVNPALAKMPQFLPQNPAGQARSNVPGQQGFGGGANTGGGQPASSFWWGKQASNEQVPRFTPGQYGYIESALEQLNKNPADFGPIAQNEIRRFHEDILPRIAEQHFGPQSQSNFGSRYPELLGRAGAGLASDLASKQQQFNMEREARLQNVALQPTFDTIRHKAQPGFAQTLTENILPSAIEAAGQFGKSWLENRRAPNVNPINSTQPVLPGGVTSGQLTSQLSNLSKGSDTATNLLNTILKENKRLGGGQ
jgi:hypothetical protein